MRLARTDIVRSRRGESVLGRISPSGGGFLGREILRRRSSIMARSDRVFGPVVWVIVVHDGVRVRDVIPIPWRRGRRRGNGHGFGAGVQRGRSSGHSGGRLEGLVGVSHGWLGRSRLGNIFGGSRRQSIIELRGTATHQGILIWLPLGIHIFLFFLFFFTSPTPFNRFPLETECCVVPRG